MLPNPEIESGHLALRRLNLEIGPDRQGPRSPAMSSSCGKALGVWSPAGSDPPGTELFRQGSSSEAVYLIDRGLVKLTRIEQNGEELIVGLRRSGWVLGSAAALLERSHATTAVTVTRCRLRCSQAADFRRMVRTDRQESWRLLQMQSQEHYEQVQAAGLARLPARQRLEHFLWKMISTLESHELQRSVKLQIPLKQWELALLLGVTREHLSRLLKQLEDECLLQRRKGWWIVSDARRLSPETTECDADRSRV